MRVIARSTLVKFSSQAEYLDSEGALQSWYDEAIKASWATPQDIKEQYRSASICGNNRVVFNIAGESVPPSRGDAISSWDCVGKVRWNPCAVRQNQRGDCQ